MIRSFSGSGLRRLLAASATALLLATAPAAAEEEAAATPQVVTIKMERVLAESAAAKEAGGQLEALAGRLRQDFRARDAELKVEEQAIAAVRSQIDEAEFSRRVQAFQQRRRQYEEDMIHSEERLDGARKAVLSELRRQLAPVLQEIMMKRQAQVMLDESQIVLAARDLDVTEEAIRAFDAVAKPIEVRLPDPK